METILELLKSPAFWFASVFIAFLMSLFASYTKDWLQRIYAHFSSRRRAKPEAQDKAIRDEAQQLAEDPLKQVLTQTELVYIKLRQILYLIVQYLALFFAMFSVTVHHNSRRPSCSWGWYF